MLRRVAIAALPLLFVAAALGTVALSLSNGHVSPGPSVARAAPAPRPHRSALPRPPVGLVGAAARSAAIPILMYHVVAVPPANVPNPGLWVTPQVFTAEMRALRRAGYWAITLRQAWRAWTRGSALPRKPIVISFDDGYRGDYTHARPVLRHYGWPGVLNLELHNVAVNNLRAGQVRSLIRNGWEIDSHTVDHPDLTTLTPQRLRYELEASRAQIERRFGVHPYFFCYPYGRYNATVEAAVRAAGYLAATTEVEGFARPGDPFALRRVRVESWDTAASLLAKLVSERPPG